MEHFFAGFEKQARDEKSDKRLAGIAATAMAPAGAAPGAIAGRLHSGHRGASAGALLGGLATVPVAYAGLRHLQKKRGDTPKGGDRRGEPGHMERDNA